MRLWARLVTVHPNICLLVAVAITILLGLGLPKLGFDIRPNATITSDNKPTHDLNQLKETFGPDDNDIVIMIDGADLLSPGKLEALREFRDAIQSIDQVQHVVSVFDVRKSGRSVSPLIPTHIGDDFDPAKLCKDLLASPVAANQLVCKEGRLLVMWARIKGGSLTVSSISAVIDPIRDLAETYKSATGAEIYLAGHPAVRADVLVLLKRAMFISCTAAAVICFFVSWFLLRRIVVVVIAVLPPAVGALWTFGLMAWSGEPVGGLTTALPNLMFAIGLTNSIHLLLDGQRHLCAGRSKEHAIYGMIVRIGPACLLTSLTTMIGFGSLTLSRTESVQTFGLWSAVGTSLVMLADLFVLPILMHWASSECFSADQTKHQSYGIWINRLVSPTLKYAGVTTAIAVVVCCLLCIPAISQQPDIIWTESIPDQSDSVVASNLADERFGGALLAYVVVQWPESMEFPDAQILRATMAVHKVFRESEKFEGDFSIANVLAVTPGKRTRDRYRTFARSSAVIHESLINAERRSLVVSSRVPNDGAASLNTRIEAFQQDLNEIREEYPDFRFTVTGTVVAASQNMHEIILDLARSLAIAAALVFLVFTIVFRSIKIGLLSVIPNAFPLLVAAAGLTLLGFPLQITTALTFSLCLGLAVDDTMHVLIRYRAIRQLGSKPTTAVRRTINHVGPALVVTTLILFAGFASMMTSPLPSVRIFAAMCGLTLVTALVGDLLILPAMLVFVDRCGSKE